LAAWYAYPMAARTRKESRSMSSESSSQGYTEKIRHVLTETRMVLPGAQALLGFGTVAALTDGFEELPPLLRAVHTTGLCFIAVAIILLMTPAAYHRIAEGGEQTEHFHRVASRLLLAAMAALAPGMAAGLWIVLERTTSSRSAGVIGAGLTVVLFYSTWFGWTLLARARDAARARPAKRLLPPRRSRIT
jgi:hypothetical protein